MRFQKTILAIAISILCSPALSEQHLSPIWDKELPVPIPQKDPKSWQIISNTYAIPICDTGLVPYEEMGQWLLDGHYSADPKMMRVTKLPNQGQVDWYDTSGNPRVLDPSQPQLRHGPAVCRPDPLPPAACPTPEEYPEIPYVYSIMSPYSEENCSRYLPACNACGNEQRGAQLIRQLDFSGNFNQIASLLVERTYATDKGKGTWSFNLLSTYLFYFPNTCNDDKCIKTNDAVTIYHAGGQYTDFVRVGAKWIGPHGKTGRLTGDNIQGWIYTNELNEERAYAPVKSSGSNVILDPAWTGEGRLTAIADKLGNKVTLEYSNLPPYGFMQVTKMTDNLGRSLVFGYDATTGQLTTITDPKKQDYIYKYNAKKLLESVTYPDGGQLTYLYGEANHVATTPESGVDNDTLLTGIKDTYGTRLVSYFYNAKGERTKELEGAISEGVGAQSYSYGAEDANGKSSAQITDALNVTRTYNYQKIQNVYKLTGITGQPCEGCFKNISYDNRGNVISETDFKNYTTCYSYDSEDLENYRIEGLAAGATCPTNLASYIPSTVAGSTERKVSTQWNTEYRRPTVIAEPYRISKYSFKIDGNIESITIQATTDATGVQGVNATLTGLPNTQTFSYLSNGLLDVQDGPRTDVVDTTRYTYDTLRNLSSITNALSHTTTLSNYTANGYAQTITDPNSLITTIDYDAMGRIKSIKRGDETTTYTIPAGKLTDISYPSGATLHFDYDNANRLSKITDKSKNTITYTLDALGNHTKVEIKNSAGNLVQVSSRIYNNLNQLWKDIGAVNTETTLYEYDNNYNVTKITDPLSRVTTHNYDALNRLTDITDPILATENSAGISKFVYNGLDQLVQVTDPRNVVTQYKYDGLNNLLQKNSLDSGTTNSTFDSAGNMLTRTDAKGQKATYSYDALNRPTKITYSKTATPTVIEQTILYEYDQGTYGKGHLSKITDNTGSTSYSYNQKGRLTSETHTIANVSYTTSYGYNETAGLLNKITYPSGRTVDYTFDTQGRINKISTSFAGQTQVLASNISYFPFGDVESFTFGDGLTQPVQTFNRAYDQNGRVANYTLGKQSNSGINKGNQYSLVYDYASQIKNINNLDLSNNATLAGAAYDYNKLGNLTDYTQTNVAAKKYVYDKVGNRTSQTIGTTTSTLAYATNSNRLNSISKNGLTTNTPHDANGSITADVARSKYGYDIRGRLISTESAAGEVNYHINALGQRVRKQSANNDTVYHYDNQGLLIGESNTGSPTLIKEYIYLGDIPVAVMQ